jgi:hypothetical protein
MKMNMIKKSIFLFMMFFLMTIPGYTQLFSDQDSPRVKGRKIIEAADTMSHTPLQMEYEASMLIIKGNPDNPIIRKSKNYEKKYTDDTRMRLSVSTYPSSTKILTHSYKNKDDDIWIKLSSGSAKRISGKGKHGYVQNSHFTYEDMESVNIDDYEYEYKGEVELKIDGQDTPCYKVQREKVRGEESIYSKADVYLRKSDLFTVRIDLWDLNNHPHKTIRMLKIANLESNEGKYTIAVKTGVSLVDDPETRNINEGNQQYTIMEMKNIRIDENTQIDESKFRKESL